MLPLSCLLDATHTLFITKDKNKRGSINGCNKKNHFPMKGNFKYTINKHVLT